MSETSNGKRKRCYKCWRYTPKNPELLERWETRLNGDMMCPRCVARIDAFIEEYNLLKPESP